jgi:hypothetical protein
MEVLRAWATKYGGTSEVRMVLPEAAELRSIEGVRVPFEKVGRLNGHAWEQTELPLHCHNDILVNLCNTGPVLQRSQLVVLHDAGVKATRSSYKWAFRSWQSFLIWSLMRKARTVATVSKFSASELMRYFPGARKSI